MLNRPFVIVSLLLLIAGVVKPGITMIETKSGTLEIEMIDDRYPIRYVNTGLWALLVPIKKLSYFHDMCPHTKDFPDVLKEKSTAAFSGKRDIVIED